MILDLDGWIIDHALDLARNFTRLLDVELADIDRAFKESDDLDEQMLSDCAEHACGVGFVVIQRYVTSISNFLEQKNKEHYLGFGPMHSSGNSIATIINAGANYWKHRDEWDMDKLDKRQVKTAEIIQSVTTIDTYTCVSLLNQITTTGSPRLAQLIDQLEVWRDALRKQTNG